ncbi:MAG: NosD domain-containing protein, partial [Promethearchaeota archaeon]
MKNVAKYHLERKFFCWLPLALIIISCFFNINPILVNNGPNINEAIMLHSSNKPNYPSGISNIIIDNNWTETEALYDWCNGSGSWDDPYIIHDIWLDCEEKGSGILVNNSQSSYFEIRNCTFYNCSNFAGIKLENSVNGQLFDNNLSYYNQFGIELVNVYNSSIFSNNISNNEIGIFILGTNETKFYDNIIFDNSIVGVNITSTTSETNTFHNNNFTDNGVNAYDAGTDTEWDNGTIGNFWDDYGGVDLDDDGFGDDPYFVDGPANAQDNYPIWNDGDDISPILTVISPLNNTIWSSPPQINVSAYDINLDTIWYLVGGSEQIEELQNETAEFLLSTFWNGLPEGKFNISYYANDTSGNINEAIVLDLYKDTQAPFLNIISPFNHTYWNTRPTIQVSVSDTYFQSVWYEIDGQKEGLENGIPETLNISLWDTILNESPFTIQFYANDTSGNLNDSYSLYLHKDITDPTLTINLPGDDTYWNIRPNVQATATDTNFDSVWYVVDGTKIILTNGVSELLDQGIWDALSNEETFTIYFYANDSAGNVNSLHSRTIHKDDTNPTLTINLPADDTYWNVRFNVQATAIDLNFDSVWYVVDGTKIILTNGVSELLDQGIWDALMDEETFTINYFANDSAGNVNSLHSRTIHKDITDPTITNLPGDDTYWNSRPNVQTTATDTNIDSVWYVVDGTKVILTNGVSELLDQGIWDGLMAEETFTIYFYANDSAGNVNSLHSRTIHKDITDPILAINLPGDDTYWNVRFNVQATATDLNFDSVWYVVDGTKVVLTNGVSELLDQGIWDALSNEETFTIYFYANDSAGNVNSLHSRTIHKDVTNPTLTINLPADGTYWNVRFNVQATATDLNFDSVWYVVDGTKIILTKTFTINYFANDSAGNVNSLHSRTIHKDVTNPTLTINLPADDTYWNVRFNVQATATDLNFDSVWYVIDGTKVILTNGVSELLDQGIWDGLMDEETFTINYFANDSAGNVNSLHSCTIHKDITDPILTVNLPVDDTYWNSRPDVQATVTDTNFDSVW